ncbi:MAG: ABC transporter permease [Microgenomates group bacterium Gr01-1014_16]|nr:MAG: ABC transporter permease [Microgenomates group bacterium Gr01-1014_16]
MNIKRSIKLLFLYAKAGQMTSWEYRFGYFFRLIRIFMDFGIALVFINVFFSKTSSIGNWNQAEIFLVYALFQMVNSTYNFFCGDSLNDLDYDVQKGKLDFSLLKPIDSQFIVSFKNTYPSNAYRVILSIIVMIYAFGQLHLSFSPSIIVWGIISVISSTVIYYCLILLASLSSFWTSRGEVTELMNTIFSVSKYPLDIFRKPTVQLLTFIPLIFLVTVPARVILGKPDHLHYLSPFLAVAIFYISRKFWLLALRHYSSASS